MRITESRTLCLVVIAAPARSTRGYLRARSGHMYDRSSAARSAGSGFIMVSNTARWRGRNETMEHLATQLAIRLGAPVADATGLEGEYDYDLIFAPKVYTGGGTAVSPLPPIASPNPSSVGNEAAAPLEHSLLRDSLEEQVGLNLQAVKTVRVDVIVLDNANREPTGN